MARFVRDKITGRKRRVDVKRSKIMKKAARSRKNKNRPMLATTRRKIRLAIKRAHKTGKTKYGRKTKYKSYKKGFKNSKRR